MSALSLVVFWGALVGSASASTSYNTGSLGKAGDGTHTESVVLDQSGAVAGGIDHAVYYAGGERTTIPWLAELNPVSNQPFTIEFWAKPEASDGDDAPLGGRVGGNVNRSGWVFFQRDEATGYNFRMYDGNGSAVGWDLTGGTYTFNQWCHVVAVWNGSSAKLYVNGILADETNAAGKSGAYVSSLSAIFTVGALFDGSSPSTGLVDEIAWYPTVLGLGQIAAHFATAPSAAAGVYRALVKADGAVLYLQQNPPEVSVSLVGDAPVVEFTGILSESTGFVTWQDLIATSPYTVPVPRPRELYFRAHR
jgi:hypothetical protein